MDLRSQPTAQYYPMDKSSIPMNYTMEKDGGGGGGGGKVMPNEMSAFELPTTQHMYPNVIYPQNYTAYKNWAAELEYNRYIYASANIRQQLMVNAQNAAAAIGPTYINQPQRKCGPICEPTCPLNPSPPKKQNSQGFRPLFPSKTTPPVALVTPNLPKLSPAPTPAINIKDTTTIAPAPFETIPPPAPQPQPSVPQLPIPIKPSRKTPLPTPPADKPKKIAPARQKPEKVAYFSEEDYIKEITRMAGYLTKINPKKDTNYPCGKLSCLAGKKDHDNQPVHQMCCVVIEFLQYVQLYSFSLELIMNGLPRRQPYYKMFTHGQLEAKLKHSITTRWTYQTCDVRYNLTHDIFRRLLLFNSHMENLGLKDVVKENLVVAEEQQRHKDDKESCGVVEVEVKVKVKENGIENREQTVVPIVSSSSSKCDRVTSHPDESNQKDPVVSSSASSATYSASSSTSSSPLKRTGVEEVDDEPPPLKKLKEPKSEARTPEPDELIMKKESDDESVDSPINYKEECFDDFGDWQHGLTIDEYLQMNGNFLD